jgi:glycosyltransferase involved in cell wall biosynthesis
VSPLETEKTAVNAEPVQIAVCICTFQRPALLSGLLRAVAGQQTDGLFTPKIVVVDNDLNQSAREVVETARSQGCPVEYHVEPEQNIALARNRAVRHASGELVALIDDDEAPPPDWLLTLFRAQRAYQSDGILGPVLPRYETDPPTWVVRGRFYDRPSHPTGTILSGDHTRTGNALLRRALFEREEHPFRADFGRGGEDRDFFKRRIAEGCRFVWCAEAAVHEIVPAVRCTRSFMIRRALLRGTIPQFTAVDFLTSLVAVPVYSVLLPVLLLGRHHLFMKVLVKNFDHLGRLLAFCGISAIRQRYVVE